MIMTGFDNTDLLVNTRESKPMSKCMQGGKGGRERRGQGVGEGREREEGAGGRRREGERGGGRG